MTPYEIITRKRDGHALNREEIDYIINGTDGSIPDYQLAAWLMAVYFQGMTSEEAHYLTQAMLHSGDVIDLGMLPGVKVDKHSTGGVGDKVSIILAPVVAAAGVPVPMISGRGLGHTGGTLDKLQSISGFRVDYSVDEFRDIVDDIGVCLIGQTGSVAPADKKLYALRDVTATIQSIPLISASIMSKKLAEGIDALVLDVKTGRGAFMQDSEKSLELAKSLTAIGEQAGKKTVAFITNMDQPLGYAVGNWLEICECIDCLQGRGPADLMELTYRLCGAMIWLGGKSASIDGGELVARQMVKNGRAWDKFLEIVKRQEGSLENINDPQAYGETEIKKDVNAVRNGYISQMDALEIGLTSVQLGAGRQKWEDKIDPRAGIMLHKKIGDKVLKGESLMTIYTEKTDVASQAVKRLGHAVSIQENLPKPTQLIHDYIDATHLK